MINIQTVNHIASLARIQLTEKETAKMQKELAAILDYIDTLNQVKTEGVFASAFPLGVLNVSRQDKARLETEQVRKDMLEQAPDMEGQHIRVKEVFK